jgi:hypothetical protein
MPLQATIYGFAIYYRPLLSLRLCLSHSSSLPLFFFFCQQRLYAHAPFYAYTCHCAIFHERQHTCTNEANDDSGTILFKRKALTQP